MSKIPDSIQIVEGSTNLVVPLVHSARGPGKRIGRVFYNEQMAFNRDLTIMVFRALDFAGRKALDSMAGTGARGVRVSNEVGEDFKFYVNDKDVEAFRYIQKNIELNDLDNCLAVNSDMKCLLSEHAFDYIDVDPFGTPVPYVSAAVQGCKRRGILGITATDTAPLAGTHPKKCIRRYGARPVRCSFGHELGLRILIGYVVRKAAEFDKGVRPMLCFYADHYFRMYLRLQEGAGEADKSLHQLGYVQYDPETGIRSCSLDQYHSMSFGPIWAGPLYDRSLLSSMNASEGLARRARCEKYLSLWKEEVDVPYFYDNDEIASLLHASPPTMERLLEKIREVGRASRTHFSPTGFKTDLTLAELMEIMSEIV
ncbi:MAG: tRNA (guanine(10)-N(2))-dimethyltransferase [Methanomassiliicoccales archaeon]